MPLTFSRKRALCSGTFKAAALAAYRQMHGHLDGRVACRLTGGKPSSRSRDLCKRPSCQALYMMIHPPQQKWERRVQCLRDLKAMGFQVCGRCLKRLSDEAEQRVRGHCWTADPINGCQMGTQCPILYDKQDQVHHFIFSDVGNGT
jgi:hypothetical protein